MPNFIAVIDERRVARALRSVVIGIRSFRGSLPGLEDRWRRFGRGLRGSVIESPSFAEWFRPSVGGDRCLVRRLASSARRARSIDGRIRWPTPAWRCKLGRLPTMVTVAASIALRLPIPRTRGEGSKVIYRTRGSAAEGSGGARLELSPSADLSALVNASVLWPRARLRERLLALVRGDVPSRRDRGKRAQLPFLRACHRGEGARWSWLRAPSARAERHRAFYRRARRELRRRHHDDRHALPQPRRPVVRSRLGQTPPSHSLGRRS